MARGAGTLPAPVLGIRLVIQVLVLAVIYKRLESNGALQLVRNYVFVHNPYESACGLLHDGPKEFLILSDNVVHNNTVGAGLGMSLCLVYNWKGPGALGFAYD